MFTSQYGQPYIYLLLYKKMSPLQWQQGGLANYDFRTYTYAKESWDRHNTLFVHSPDQIPVDTPGFVTDIKSPTGKVIFRIVKVE